MSMVPQVSSVCRAIYHQLRQISRVRKYLTDDACATVVNALVISRLDCNNALLYGLPNALLSRLQVAPHCAARVVARVRRREPRC